MIVSRENIIAARHPKCSWDAAALSAAIEARFPGGGDIELADLIDAWLADPGLPSGTLIDCAIISSRLAGVRPGRMVLRPATALARIRATL